LNSGFRKIYTIEEFYNMMKTFKKFLVAGFLVMSLGAGSNFTVAAETQSGMAQPISNTITHLDAALKAVNANELEAAQEHIKAAGQSSKDIFGGSFESKKQRGSRAIANARRQMKEGNTASAADSIKAAIEVFKSLLQPVEGRSQGGLK
jgi:hypothetical protein